MVAKKALFLRFSSLGDIIISNYYAMVIKRRHPDWHITWLCDSLYAPLLREQSWVDSVIGWDRKSTGNTGFLRTLRQVRAAKFDIIIDMHSTDRSTFFVSLSGIPLKYGRKNNKIPFNVYTGDICDLKAAEDSILNCPRYLEPGAPSPAAEYLFAGRTSSPVLILAIGASYAKKQWPADSWVGFARLAAAKDFCLVLVGAGADEERASRAIEACVGPGRVANMVGRLSLTELVQVIDKGDLVITGDTGPLHIAKALGVPAIGLFGPSLVEKGYMASLYRVFYSDCREVGCGNWRCAAPCLGSIAPETIMDCVEDFFAEKLVSLNVGAD